MTGVRERAEALYVFQREAIDLAILDIAMPGKIDGFALLRMIRELPHGADLPIIMLTASGRDEDVYAARDAGVDRFLTKPTSSQVVTQIVRELRQLVNLHQRLRDQMEALGLDSAAAPDVKGVAELST